MKKLLLSLALAFAFAAQALAGTITVSGTICDANGCAPFSQTVTTDAVSIVSQTVVPQTAAPGTTRTLTVVGTSSAGLALTATVNAVPGITFTPVTGQPAGTFVWTFVY